MSGLTLLISLSNLFLKLILSRVFHPNEEDEEMGKVILKGFIVVPEDELNIVSKALRNTSH